MIASIKTPCVDPLNFAPDPGDIPDVFKADGNEVHDGRNDADFDDFSAKAKTLASSEEESGNASTFDNKEFDANDTSSKGDKVDVSYRYVTPKDFDLLKVIGMGAFGKVLQVRNRQNQKILAMKIISKRLLKRNSGYIENVQSERDILTKIRHPFVVTMHCSFQTKEKLFIIMDFLAGGELFLRLGREGIFLETTAAFYLGEITLALDHLHTRGVLHRDLKPENILLCSDGHVCVTDFGLARDLSSEAGFGGFSTEEDESRARTVCGTQEYMSPEMLSRKGYGRASDWWSLGCIAFEMLSGRPPFESRKGAKDLFRKIMSERVKMPDGATAC
jgi:ribosomal protein S6 kinase beta